MPKFYTNVIKRGDSLLIREVDGQDRTDRKVKYKPSLFVPTKKESKYRSLHGEVLAKVDFESINDCEEFLANYTNNRNLIYGMTLHPYAWIANNYRDTIDYDMSMINTVTIDIEVACENGFPDPNLAEEEMLSVTLKEHKTNQIIVIGIGEYETSRQDVLYLKCETEKELLEQFVYYWSSIKPDILTGWNTKFFDVPYLVNRIRKVLGGKSVNKLSPWGAVKPKISKALGRDMNTYTIQGVSSLDYYDLYKKFTYTNQESYKLDHIAFVELGERKDENPYETFRDWYTNDYQSFIDYNIQDVEIVDKLESKMKLIELVITMAYEARVNYEDAFTSVKYWDILIYNYLLKRNIMIPQKTDHGEKKESFEGAYVKDPQVGSHRWVMSFDLNSLYPHLIMQYNLSPETISGKLPGASVEKFLNSEIDVADIVNSDTTIAANGSTYSKASQGFLPAIMQEMYEDRSKYKKLMLKAQQEYEDTKNPKLSNDISKYNNIQMAKKISLNSAYGAIGNQYFRFFDLNIAEAITLSGQLSIRWIENKINQYLNGILNTKDKDYVIASDTDSVYIRFDELVSNVFPENPDRGKVINFLDTIAKEKIEPFIDESYQELADYMNAYDQKMQMKREVIADKGIWTAKKRYILNAWDVEGVRYKEPKLKIMGIEAVKSSTPYACRENIKEALKLIMQGSEKQLQDFVETFRKKFDSLEVEDISFPRSANGISTWSDKDTIYKKSTPIHVKGGILYNFYIKKKKLKSKYPLVQDGDKVRYVELKTPNPLNAPVLSYITKFPREFKVQEFIDYDSQFEKSFLAPLKFITDSIGWAVTNEGSLEDFFA